MKTKALVIAVAIGASFLAVAVVVAKQTTKKVVPAGYRVCGVLGQQPGFMTSWAGQPGTPDYSASQSVRKGTWFGCLALAAIGSSVPPACVLTYENDGQYTLPSRNAMNSPSADVVTLTCNGQQPTCCAVQVAGTITAEAAKKH